MSSNRQANELRPVSIDTTFNAYADKGITDLTKLQLEAVNS